MSTKNDSNSFKLKNQIIYHEFVSKNILDALKWTSDLFCYNL